MQHARVWRFLSFASVATRAFCRHDKAGVTPSVVDAYRQPQLVRGWEKGLIRFTAARLSGQLPCPAGKLNPLPSIARSSGCHSTHQAWPWWHALYVHQMNTQCRLGMSGKSAGQKLSPYRWPQRGCSAEGRLAGADETHPGRTACRCGPEAQYQGSLLAMNFVVITCP